MKLLALAGLCLAAAPCSAVTLRQLSMDDLIGQSTAVIRGRVLTSYGAVEHGEVFTHAKVQVSERWKGAAPDVTDIVFPGGTAGKVRQSIPGMPRLQEGQEYVLYLWTSPSGLTFVTGFQQGVFTVSPTADGQLMVQRPATSEMMLDRTGRPIIDSPVRMRLQEMSAHVAAMTKGTSR